MSLLCVGNGVLLLVHRFAMKSVPDQHACTYTKCHLHIDAPRVKGEVMCNTPPAHFFYKWLIEEATPT